MDKLATNRQVSKIEQSFTSIQQQIVKAREIENKAYMMNADVIYEKIAHSVYEAYFILGHSVNQSDVSRLIKLLIQEIYLSFKTLTPSEISLAIIEGAKRSTETHISVRTLIVWIKDFVETTRAKALFDEHKKTIDRQESEDEQKAIQGIRQSIVDANQYIKDYRAGKIERCIPLESTFYRLLNKRGLFTVSNEVKKMIYKRALEEIETSQHPNNMSFADRASIILNQGQTMTPEQRAIQLAESIAFIECFESCPID